MSYKSNTLINEINTITDENMKQFCIDMLESEVPDYFFTCPASSSGKYHSPSCIHTGYFKDGNLIPGGLIIHTKALVMIANDLMNLSAFNFPEETKNAIRVGGILHDAWKQGEGTGGHTVHDHPLIAARHIVESCNTAISKDTKEFIATLVSSHMGQFCSSKYSSVVLPVPESHPQRFLHMCDYLASRKYLEYIFEEASETPAPKSTNPDDFVMKFGKYKGNRFGDIKQDKGYLVWLKENCDLKEPLKTYINNELMS